MHNRDATRLLYIDSLRGLAALGVAWFHLYTTIIVTEPDVFGTILNYTAVWGRWGVQLFFIISGFVLAFSLQKKYLMTSISAVGRYFVKRSIRLDPAYWFTIAVTLGLVLWFNNEYLSNHAKMITSFSDLLYNLFYLNWIFDHGMIITISWTLALEIQLYLFFAILLYIAHLSSRIARLKKETSVFILIALSATYSLLWPLQFFKINATVFTGCYFMFISGVIVYNSIVDKKYLLLLIVFDSVLGACVIMFRDTSSLAILLAHGLILAGAHIPVITNFMKHQMLQYFGKLSYCIYLLHVPIGLTSAYFFVYTAGKITDNSSRYIHITAAVFAVMMTIIVSHCLHFYVEKPSLALSKKIKFRVKNNVDVQH